MNTIVLYPVNTQKSSLLAKKIISATKTFIGLKVINVEKNKYAVFEPFKFV